ncbi:MAG: folate family ECF transporter S component [Clostridia bacterium]|nr:folate family ECF transporter S component [Clostridia bacterium]
MQSKKQQLFKIILTALLIALNLVLERILPSYKIWNQDISFGFLAIAFAAAFLGTPYAAIVAGAGDLIGSLLFPFGAYFPGFTLTNCIYGIILAEFIYKNATPLKILICVILNKVACSLILNTLWISLMYRGGVDAFFVVLVPRLVGTAIIAVIEFVVLLLLFSDKSHARKLLDKNLKKFI